MSRRTGPTNEHLNSLINDLKKESAVHKNSIWKRIAFDLEKPTRQRRIVNVSRLNRHTSDNDTVVIPGKVLGSGTIDHSIVVAAFSFSQSARSRIEDAKGKCITIGELIKKNPKGTNIKIIG